MNDEELEQAMRATLRSHAADAPPAGVQTAEVAQRRVRTRRRSTLVAGAVAGVLAVTGGVVVAANYDDVDNAPSASRNVDREVIPGGVPSVFAYDEKFAVAMLEDNGLVVTVKPFYTCETQGRAVRTRPAAGTRVQPGDPVTLFVTTPSPNARCAFPAEDAPAWELLDFVNKIGPAPSFAPEVTTYVDGERTVLTRAEAADPDTWKVDSALDLLVHASRRAWFSQDESGAEVSTPKLVVQRESGSDSPSWCGKKSLPSALADRPSFVVLIILPTDEGDVCASANLFQTDGKIDAVVLRGS